MMAAKKPFDANAIMNSPEMKKAMQSSAKTLANGEKFRSKGTVTGNKYNAPAPAPAKAKSDLKRTAQDLARGVAYVRDRGKKRAAGVNKIIDEASR